jgi:hypothetical protein
MNINVLSNYLEIYIPENRQKNWQAPKELAAKRVSQTFSL